MFRLDWTVVVPHSLTTYTHILTQKYTSLKNKKEETLILIIQQFI